MDVLARITSLRKMRNWSVYELSVHSGLTQSTISSWYKKNTVPTIPSLAKICDAFHISMSDFFREVGTDDETISEQDARLIEYASRFSPDEKDALLEFLRRLYTDR